MPGSYEQARQMREEAEKHLASMAPNTPEEQRKLAEELKAAAAGTQVAPAIWENPSEAVITEDTEGKLTNEIKHKYISTACEHDLHTRCRRVCKFCPARCLCWCHEGEAAG